MAMVMSGGWSELQLSSGVRKQIKPRIAPDAHTLGGTSEAFRLVPERFF